MPDLTVIMRGPFDDEDLERLGQALRQCEQKNPEAVYAMVVDDKRDSAEARIVEKIKKFFPNGGYYKTMSREEFEGGENN